jgi:hypothetical protein
MTTIEVVFVGMCALIFDHDLTQPYDNPGKQAEGKAFEVVLPDAPGHDAEMWILCEDLEGGCGAAANLGSCADPTAKCVKWANLKVDSMQICKDEANVYAVWCLEESRVNFYPDSSAGATFHRGRRSKPNDTAKRHFKDKKPTSDDAAKDRSWIAEPNKAFGGGYLNSKYVAETRVTQLKGDLRASFVPDKGPLKNAKEWNWCHPTYEGLKMTRCVPASAGLPEYDQVFAEAVAVDIKVKTPVINIEHRDDETVVILDTDRVTPKVYIQNIPRHTGLTETTDGSDDICVADHFRYYAELLDDHLDPKDVRLPYRVRTRNNCAATPLHGKGAGGVHYLVTDSFCPPGGISRNP